MDNNVKEEIFFSNENIFEIIAEILSKNGLEETVEDAAEKDDSLILFVFDLIKDLLKEKISEKDFINSLQTNLKISIDASNNILEDVKEKIFPYAEKIKIGGQSQEENLIIVAPPKIDQNVIERLSTEEPTLLEKEKTIERKRRTIKNIIKPSEIVKKDTLNSPKKPDNYREPIE